MVDTILTSNFAVNVVYPFLLIFTIVFAILEKSRILGEGKRQIDAIVALVVALIAVSFTYATHIISYMIPVLAVILTVLFVFLLIWGFVASGNEGLQISKGMKIAIGVIATIVLIVTVVVVAGYGDFFVSLFTSGNNLWVNILMLLIIGAAIAVVLFSGKKNEK